MGFDIFMVAYQERNAAENWARLLTLAPDARRIEGIAGIERALAACAKASRTPFFFQIDADNWLLDGFRPAPDFEPGADEVAIWQALNPVNGLRYGHGGVKLFSVASFAVDRRLSVDAPTSLGGKNRYLREIASEHRFNTDPETTWSVAFRECAKLAQATTVGGLKMREVSRRRLHAWCTLGEDAPFGRWSIAGSREGRLFGLAHCRDHATLAAFNDYAWMRGEFARRHGATLARIADDRRA